MNKTEIKKVYLTHNDFEKIYLTRVCLLIFAILAIGQSLYAWVHYDYILVIDFIVLVLGVASLAIFFTTKSLVRKLKNIFKDRRGKLK